MKTIPVKSIKNDYSIYVGNHLLEKSGMLAAKSFSKGAKVMVVTQKRIPATYLKKVLASLKKKGFQTFVTYIPNGEIAKSEKQLFQLIHALLKNGFDRSSGMVAVGGGVVGDLTGFVAATYMRGIPYIQIPTTLLAQVDSAIGGKTAINTKEGKNLVGAFNAPHAVISDVGTLKTLPKKELKAALAEVIKYGVIKNSKLFSFLEESVQKILKLDAKSLEKIVYESALIKAKVVSHDEFEQKGERMILNYGHTFGHGIEGALKYKKLVHGEAVGIGMLMAGDLAVKLRMVPASFQERQVALLKALGLKSSLKGLPCTTEQIFKVMQHDKKKKGGKLRYILPIKVGQVKAIENISPAKIKSSISKFS